MSFYRVHGMMQSYFTRKMTGYLDYKQIPWRFCRFFGISPEANAAGWPGGVPPMQTPDGTWMWDTTAMILHLETRHPDPSVIPSDPVAAFLSYLVEDYSDEWLYRPAVGSRWHFSENSSVGGFELARDMSMTAPLAADQLFAMVGAHVSASCPPIGVTAETIQSWIDEVLRPWMRCAGALFQVRPYLLGARPCLADFAIFGGAAAHFINDPLCRRWADADGPGLVQHTHRLFEPFQQVFGDWADADDVPADLITVLADMGRLYLPWVSRAVVDGQATLQFASGATVDVAAPAFLRNSRATLLARYAAVRCDALDAILERAAILPYFADFVADAGTVPSYETPPQPRLNRPFAPPNEAESAEA